MENHKNASFVLGEHKKYVLLRKMSNVDFLTIFNFLLIFDFWFLSRAYQFESSMFYQMK